VPSSHHAALRHRTNTAGPDRIRHDLMMTGEKTIKTSTSMSEIPLPRGQHTGDDVVTVTAMPSSFQKMEESIAAQQMLLRNMLVQGQKMMQAQQQQQQQQYYQPPMRSNAQIDVIDDMTPLVMPAPAPQRLALPPSTSSRFEEP
jgi:hypothetical protein